MQWANVVFDWHAAHAAAAATVLPVSGGEGGGGAEEEEEQQVANENFRQFQTFSATHSTARNMKTGMEKLLKRKSFSDSRRHRRSKTIQ